MNFKDFYFNEFRPSYLEGIVRYPEQTDYLVRINCAPIAFKELSEITLNDINSIIKDTDDNYCADRAKKVRAFLKRIMKYAYACRYIDFDVTSFEFRRIKRRTEQPLQMFTTEQAQFLTSGDSRIIKMFRFECLTGLRREEILGLRWENVDFKNRRIYVCETVVIIANRATHVKDTKTHKFRYVELNDSAYNILLTTEETSEFVFGNPKTKNFLSPRRYHEEYNALWFAKNREWLKTHSEGLPHLTPHKFRHTFASLLVANNVDVKTVADLLGHSKLETTSIYLHSYDDNRKQAVSSINF